ncbi:hypothetical protein [Pseudomonas baetica]|uniref:hypothetical protein n=1 Tax=Pseudomonas baetica TaxID=674054 RepID=UPI002871676D|nr:hypothetical protein [Pseudomonas baetica]MDR9863431.1 hypothetical protein [Pseudomonas baetica]
MPTRNKKDANTAIFSRLDKYCADHDETVLNTGTVRWIESEAGKDRDFLVESIMVDSLSFGLSLKIARFDFQNKSLFFTIGFDLPDEIGLLVEEDLGGGVLTAILSELSPMPSVPASFVKNIVDFSSFSSGAKYSGHEANGIFSLFPSIRCFSTSDLAEEETYRIFFLICLADFGRAKLWMNKRLRGTLEIVAELSPVAIPYRTLCRSIFDSDPSAVFMALYRCLEALYAFTHTTDLMRKLGVSDGWANVAQTLEETLGWRPREEPSLTTLLRLAAKNDLRTILISLKVTLPADDADLVVPTTKRVYQLRNTLVHYRPFHQEFNRDEVDWNLLCEAMALIVLDVYDSVVVQEP